MNLNIFIPTIQGSHGFKQRNAATLLSGLTRSFYIFCYSNHSLSKGELSLEGIMINTTISEFPNAELSLSQQLSDNLIIDKPTMRRNFSATEDYEVARKVDDKIPYSETKVNPVYCYKSKYLFCLHLNEEYFKGDMSLSGLITFSKSNETIRFSVDLPSFFADGLTNFAYMTLLSEKCSAEEIFSSNLDSLLYLKQSVKDYEDVFLTNSWTLKSLVASALNLPAYVQPPSKISLINAIQDIENDILFWERVILIGYVTEVYGGDSLVNERLLSSNIFFPSHFDAAKENKFLNKLLVKNKESSYETFSTYRWAVIGLKKLLESETKADFPKYYSCIFLLASYFSLRQDHNASLQMYHSSFDSRLLSPLNNCSESFAKLIFHIGRLKSYTSGTGTLTESENTYLWVAASRQREVDAIIGFLQFLVTAFQRIAEEGANCQLNLALVNSQYIDNLDRASKFIEKIDANIASFSREFEHLLAAIKDFRNFENRMKRESEATAVKFSKFWKPQEYSAYVSMRESMPTPFYFAVWADGKGKAPPATEKAIRIEETTFNQPTSLTLICDNYGNLCESFDALVYVADTLNNSVRTLIKPFHSKTLVGGGTNSTGVIDQVKLNLPKSVTTFTIQGGNVLYTLLIIAEANSHCIKGLVIETREVERSKGGFDKLVLPTNEVFLIAGGKGTGNVDGVGTDAQLNYPTGVCSWGNSLIVCCRGSNTLRSISYVNKKGWVVKTVAGIDSSPRGEMILFYPTACAVSKDGVYVLEQAKVPNIRLFNGEKMRPFFEGSPLKNPTALCYDDDYKSVLVCDRGASAIIMISVASRSPTILIDLDSINRFYPGLDSFNPGGITKVGLGSYLITDMVKSKIYRFMDNNCCEAAVLASQEMYSSLDSQKRHIVDAFDNYKRELDSTMQTFELGVKSVIQSRNGLLTAFYANAVNKTLEQYPLKSIPKTVILSLTVNAPNITCLLYLLENIIDRISLVDIPEFDQNLLQYLTDYNFSNLKVSADIECQAFSKLLSRDYLNAQVILSAVLKSESFIIQVCENSLELLASCLEKLDWSMDRGIAADIRRETVRWINRTYPQLASVNWSNSTHREVLENALMFWNSINPASYSEKGRNALLWLSRVFIDSLCMGFANSNYGPGQFQSDALKNYALFTNYNSQGIDVPPNVPVYTIDKAMCTLLNIFHICEMPLSPELQGIFIDVILDILRTVPLLTTIDAVTLLLQSSSLLLNSSHLFFSQIVQSVVLRTADSNLMKIANKVKSKYAKLYENQLKVTTIKDIIQFPVTDYLHDVISFDSNVWTQITIWLLERGSILLVDGNRLTNSLQEYLSFLISIYEELYKGLNTKDITVAIVKAVSTINESIFKLYQLLNKPFKSDFVTSMELDIENHHLRLRNMLQVVSVLTPESSLIDGIRGLQQVWNQTTVSMIEQILRLSTSSTSNSMLELPANLIKSVDWLLYCTEKHDFLAAMWNKNDLVDINDDTIILITQLWLSFYHSLVKKISTFEALTSYFPFLSSKQELESLVSTCIKFQENDDVRNVWQSRRNLSDKASIDQMVSNLYTMIQNWYLVKQFYTQVDHFKKLFETCKFILDEVAVAESALWQRNFEEMINQINLSGNWNSQNLSNFEVFWMKAQHFDPKCLNISIDLLSCIDRNSQFISFLKLLKDDSMFTSSMEIALSLQEMQCPSELWDKENGRINEAYLSMLRNIRSYLYTFLYHCNPKFHNFDAFISIYGGLNNAVDPLVIVDNIQKCSVVREALSQITQFNVDSASSGRLMNIYDKKFNSQWIIEQSTEYHYADTYLYLSYSSSSRSPDSSNLTVKQDKYALDDLLDFQSSVILSKANDACVQEVIDIFLFQLNWCRQIEKIMIDLHFSGHFDYFPKYRISLSVNLANAEYMDIYNNMKNELKEWKSRISEIKSRHYFLNYFEIRQISSLFHSLSSNNYEVDLAYSQFKALVCFINREYGQEDGENIKEYFNQFVSNWREKCATELSGSSRNSHLERFSECINEFLVKVPYQAKIIDLPDIVDYGIPALLPSVVYSMKLPTIKAAYESVVMLSAARKVAIDWDTCFVCSNLVTEEALVNFLRRWDQSSNNGRENIMYLLLDSHLLSFEFQDIAADIIREIASVNDSKRGPLIISCLANVMCPLSEQFQQNVITQFTTSNDLVRTVFSQLNIATYEGRSGSGKSFHIRLLGRDKNYNYCPVNGSYVSASERSKILKRVKEALSTTSSQNVRPIIHFDIASSVDGKIAQICFELALLGRKYDSHGNDSLVVHPNAEICFELSSSLPPNVKSQFELFPIFEVKIDEFHFKTNLDDLKIGMGESFESSLFYETNDNRSHTTAYDRLMYVVIALNILEVSNGTFPYIFHLKKLTDHRKEELSLLIQEKEDAESRRIEIAPTLTKKEQFAEKFEETEVSNAKEELLMAGHGIDDANSFCLLCKHLVGSNDPRHWKGISLWNLWNFVNVLYWQFNEMHHVESPLNSACMPDENSALRTKNEDIRTKRKIKGEILHFIIRTAREFATRQSLVQPTDTMEIVGVSVSGFTRTMFNHQWVRVKYDNDGKPCFRSRDSKYFLYYRQFSRCWVIDDIIETSGATYCYSQNEDINSSWTTCPPWETTNYISSRNITYVDNDAYQSEAIQITGCSRLPENSSCSHLEDGVYLRLPPYDDINKQPHYLKKGAVGVGRRHLFLNDSHVWVVAPQCNEDEGTYITSSALTSNSWRYIPPDRKEAKISFKYLFAEDSDGQTVYDAPREFARWQDSNHECILFNNSAHTVAFLSCKPSVMTQNLHPMLYSHLQQNNISVEGGDDIAAISSGSLWKMLSSLTGVIRNAAEAESLLGKSYCLTGDALLKILAIVYRMKCGIPVVLLGECGCGKTMLIRFLCKWMGVELLILDIHGGTTESDIVNIFQQAEQIAQTSDIYVFMDEINTCNHMGVITEVICHRTINGCRIHDRIKVLGALNPYRVRRKDRSTLESAGLQVTASPSQQQNVPLNNMKQLVYKVHPIPDTLRDLLFDFGSLEEKTEFRYIETMVKASIKSVSAEEADIITHILSRSQVFLREYEDDPSVVSLRDIQRCLNLINWFHQNLTSGKREESASQQQQSQDKHHISTLCRATVLAVGHVYGYRLPTLEVRVTFWTRVSSMVKSLGRVIQRAKFSAIGEHGVPQTILENMQRRFVNNLEIEPGIALNQALTENLFVTIICILNKLPVFIVGKPGTSKTLSIQIIASNLLGSQSPKPLWRRFPAVYIFQYQCSPMSTAASIMFQYKAAVSYQKHSQDVMTVLLLDEVGLAENSPDMPLKVLHYMLTDPPISIVGLSNWVLDSSKMNRSICLQRIEPSASDLTFTGQNILSTSLSGGESKILSWLSNVSKSFHTLYNNQSTYFGQGSRAFIGMRDYYALLKQIIEISNFNLTSISPDILNYSISRNFNGHRQAMPLIRSLFFTNCFPGVDLTHALEGDIPVATLIEDNLKSTTSRNLMLLSSSNCGLELLLGRKLVPLQDTEVLFGSEFAEDVTELFLINQINKIRNAMARGSVVVLVHNECLFESLYDVLNQRFVIRKDIETGKEQRMLRLAIGPRSQLCEVSAGFKVIVVIDQYRAYTTVDLPLLNRFEKQSLEPIDYLNHDMKQLVAEISTWCDKVLSECKFTSLSDVFCGNSSNLVSSLVLYLTLYGTNYPPERKLEYFNEAISMLHSISFPAAQLLSETLKVVGKDNASLSLNYQEQIIETLLSPQNLARRLTFILTRSSLSHFLVEYSSARQSDQTISSFLPVLQLSLLPSENSLIKEVESFYQSSHAQCLVILCDPILCSHSQISHSMYLCERLALRYKMTTNKCITYFIHLPPAVKNRQREYCLSFQGSWKYLYIDDLRSDRQKWGMGVNGLLQSNCTTIFEGKAQNLVEIFRNNVHEIVSRHVIPENASYTQISYIRIFLELMQIQKFVDFVVESVMHCLKQYDEADENGNYFHVKLCLQNCSNDIGTFSDTLYAIIESMVVQAFSQVLRILDTDFSLLLLYTGVKKDSLCIDHWLRLAAKFLLETDMISRHFIAVSPFQLNEIDSNVRNNGLYGPVFCSIPFIDKLSSIVSSFKNELYVRSNEVIDVKKLQAGIAQLLESVVGSEVLESIQYFCGSSSSTTYLLDIVGLTMHPFYMVSLQETVLVINAVVNLISKMNQLPDTFSTIQASLWIYENLLWQLLQIVSLDNSVSPTSATIVQHLVSNSQISSDQASLSSPEQAIVDFVLNYFWNDISTDLVSLHDDVIRTNWLLKYKIFESNLRNIVLLALPSTPIDKLHTQLRKWFSTRCFYSIFESSSKWFGNDFIEKLLKISIPVDPFSKKSMVDFLSTFSIVLEAGIQNFVLGRTYIKDFVFYFGDLFPDRIKRELVEKICKISFSVQQVDSSMIMKTQRDVVEYFLQPKHYYLDVLIEKICAHRNFAAFDLLLDALEENFLKIQPPNLHDDTLSFSKYLSLHSENQLEQSFASLAEEVYILRNSIAQYAETFSYYLMHRSSTTEPIPPIPSHLQEVFTNCNYSRLYFVKMLKRLGGTEVLLDYFQCSNLPFLPDRMKTISNKSNLLSVTDPFPLLNGKQEYFDTCSLYAKQLSKTAVDEWIHKITALNSAYDVNVMSGLLISSCYMCKVSDEQSKLLLDWTIDRHSARFRLVYDHICQSKDIISSLHKYIVGLKSDNKSKHELFMERLLVNVAIVIVQNPNTWLAGLFASPFKFKTHYLPSMPKSDLEMIARASGHVGWYRCKNGHPYSVGNCTYPMETSYCRAPGCGVLIGGKNHQAVASVTRVDNFQDFASSPGYITETEENKNTKEKEIINVSKLVMRCLLHFSLLLAVRCGKNQDVGRLLGLSNLYKNVEALEKFLQDKIEQDFSSIKSHCNFGDDDASLGFHIVLSSWSKSILNSFNPYATFERSSARDYFEDEFHPHVHKIFDHPSGKEIITNTRQDLNGSKSISLLRNCCGDEWTVLHESFTLDAESNFFDGCKTILFKIRQPLTLLECRKQFSADKQNAKQHLLCKTLFENEKILNLRLFHKCIPAILQWHSFLFQILPVGLTKQQANTTSNIEAINLYAAAERVKEGLEKLKEYCEAFNSSFYLVEYLYECNENPFLTEDGRVDLSGSKRGLPENAMTENTTLNFSLPSLSHGETDASGLCTVKLLSRLQEVHNAILDASTYYKTPAGNEGEGDTSNSRKYPVVTHATPVALVKENLINIDPELDLLAILKEEACDHRDSIQFQRVERQLIELFTQRGFCPIIIHTMQYQFSGELKKSGGLRTLQLKVHQVQLSSRVIDTIWVELDTKVRLRALMTAIEHCIQFIISSFSSSGVSQGEMPLIDYLTTVLFYSDSKIDTFRCPTLCSNGSNSGTVRLCHLQSLFLGIESRSGEDPLAGVALKYRDPIPEALSQIIKTHCMSSANDRYDLNVLLPAIRDFATEQLVTDRWAADASLKVYLIYSTEVPLEDMVWFTDNFPADLALAYTVEAYNLLSTIASSGNY